MMTRLTARGRLTLLYGAMVFLCGAGLIALLYVLMRYVPQYVFQTTTGSASTDPSMSAAPCAASAPGLDGAAGGPSCLANATSPALAGMAASSVTISSEGDVLSTLLIMSAVALVVLTIVAVAVGWWISGRLLAPIHRITHTARRVAAGNLAERINLPGNKSDELTELADTFDEMLTRLDRSFAAQQRFAANASHELRTPITTTRTLVQVAMANPSAVDLPRLGANLLETNRRSEHLINALLSLARADHGLESVLPVDLSAVTDAALRIVLPEAEGKGIAVDRDLPASWLAGDPELLLLLLVNLLQNGIRHNRPGGSVLVRIDRHGTGIVLSVRNTGPVVAPDRLAQFLEPFQRGAQRTHSQHAGYGLGFSIIASITQAHGGHMLAVANPAGGLTVTAHFDTAHFDTAHFDTAHFDTAQFGRMTAPDLTPPNLTQPAVPRRAGRAPLRPDRRREPGRSSHPPVELSAEPSGRPAGVSGPPRSAPAQR
jgi:signal transduction histidine kinase